jgi:hypothetical protein
MLALCLAPAAARAQAAAPAMTWPEAVELLVLERDSAELCARVAKRFLPEGDKVALTEAELGYETARAEFNGVIAGLQAALIQREEEPALATVESRVAAGTETRRTFCQRAKAIEPPPEPGEKGLLDEAVSGTVAAVLEAGVTVWSKIRDDDKQRRESLRAALDEAKWPPFAKIEP